jgi:hypothetical protein
MKRPGRLEDLLLDLLAWAPGSELVDPEPDRGRYAPPIVRHHQEWPGAGGRPQHQPWPHEPWPGDRR